MTTKPADITAVNIKELLSIKHSSDVFVAECKLGATWTNRNSVQRFDAWAMAKSWVNPRICGYEVKVSRSDYINDNKWQGYLPYCNEFYFVCPTGLISIDEVPEGVGLIWVSKTGTVLYTKKKAAYREIDDPVEIFKYLLFSRTWTDAEHERPLLHSEISEYVSNRKAKAKSLYGRAYKKLRTEISDVREENKKLRQENSNCEETVVLLEAMGLNPSSAYMSVYEIEKKLKQKPSMSMELVNLADRVARDMARFVEDAKRKAELVEAQND